MPPLYEQDFSEYQGELEMTGRRNEIIVCMNNTMSSQSAQEVVKKQNNKKPSNIAIDKDQYLLHCDHQGIRGILVNSQ